MPILDTNFAAVSTLQDVENFTQSSAIGAGEAASDELAIEVPDRQTVGFNIQFRVIQHRHRMKRIDIGDQVTTHAVGID